VADIFISYKREDRARIAPLARALEARGFTVWWDLELVPSQKFERQIKRELDAARCVIVVWTVRSIGEDGMYASEWIQIEANSGDQRGILLPVQLDADRIHWRHGQNQFAALHDWTGDDAAVGLQDLLKGVEIHAGPRVRPQDMELLAWQSAERTETADGFQRFLDVYSQSRFADIARGRIAELEELTEWKALSAAPTIAALVRFLRRFPTGRFADNAEAKIREIELAGTWTAPTATSRPSQSEARPILADSPPISVELLLIRLGTAVCVLIVCYVVFIAVTQWSIDNGGDTKASVAEIQAGAPAEAVDPVAAPAQDLIDTAIGSGELDTFVALVQAAGLESTLRGAGPFTLLVPTNAAFAQLPAGTVDELLAPENKDKLVALMTYHVLPGQFLAADLTDSRVDPATVNGQTLKLDTTTALKLNQSTVIVADVSASNGVLHLIDAVLLPPN
jgi:uncharacterized surface protein with fasciclin (FAS1) repeats